MYIIHISDIHYNQHFENDYFNMYQALVKDIKIINKNNEDMIMIVTGDLIDAKLEQDICNSLEESYLLLKMFADEAGILESNIYITPGNHDIAYKVYYPQEFEQLGIDNNLTEKIFMKYSKQDVTIDKYFKNMEPYYNFYKKTYINNKTKVHLSPLHSVFQLKLSSKNINIVSLNNVWRFRDYRDNESPYGDMIFGAPQLRMSKELVKNGDLKIAFCHYPIEFLHESEKRDAERDIIRGYDLFLSGHAHSSNNLRLSAPGDQINGGCIFNYGGNLNVANYKECNKKYEMSYDLIEITNDEVKIHHRKYQLGNDDFVTNTAFNKGVSEYKREGVNDSLLRFRDILHDQKENFDKNLISNNLGGTQAPKNTFDLFVSPTLKSYSEDELIPRNTNIDELISDKRNVIVFSKIETGKSTLLYGIFNKIYNKSLYNGSYPLYIDMKNNYRNNTLTKILFECYSITKKNDLIDELKKYNVVILIDNLDLNNREFCISLREFVKSYSEMQVICTSHASSSGRLPVNFAKSNLISFDAYELQPLTSLQIEDFSNRWFNGKVADYDKEVKNMMKVIGDKRITAYPLYIGMLLWLIEEKKTLNRLDQNMIIENFIDKLLEKTNKSQNTVDAFDFRNRREILGLIAEHIIKNSFNSISDLELNSIINKFLTKNKWTSLYKVNDIYNYLIATNILIAEGDESPRIKFRYHSILDYFISIQMEQSSEFYFYIIKSKSILKFHKAFDIFSSRNRKNHDYLDVIIKKLQSQLEFLKSQISLDEIDQVFERNQSLIPMIKSNHTPKKRQQIAEQSKLEQIDKVFEDCEKQNESDRDFSASNINLIDEFELGVIMLSNLIRNLEGDFEDYNKQETINMVIESSIYLGFLYDYSFKQEYFESEDKDLIPLMTMTAYFTPLVIGLYNNDNMATIKLHQYYSALKTFILEENANEKFTYSKIKEYILNIMMLENSPKLSEGISEFKKYLKQNESVLIEDNLYAYLRYLEVTSENEILIDTASELIQLAQVKHKNWEQKEKINKENFKNSKSKLIEEYKSQKIN